MIQEPRKAPTAAHDGYGGGLATARIGTREPMANATAVIKGGGSMGTAVRAHDWSTSPLGPLDGWPAALVNALNLMLNSPESMYLVWGADLTFFFNDAYRPILGLRLEGALGQSLPVLWADAWGAVRQPLEQALAGDATRFVDVPITMARHGAEEATWWSYSYSPIHDGARVGGVICFTTETTARKQAESALQANLQSLERRVEERASASMTGPGVSHRNSSSSPCRTALWKP